MKSFIFIIFGFLLLNSSLTSFTVKAEQLNDSTLIILKIKDLNHKKEILEKKIKEEDAKRNQPLPGVSQQTREQINDKQDSICLSLRSQLVNINLELKELNEI